MAFPIECAYLITEWVLSNSITQEWPACQQLFLEKLSLDFPEIVALPVVSCQVVGGGTSHAIPVAAAWSMLRYAADLFDAIQDGDNFTEIINSPSAAINYANGLLFTAFNSLTSFQEPYIVQRLITMFSRTAFDASKGHHLSTQHRYMDDTTLEGYWHSTILKSGSIFRSGLCGGAIVGKAPEKQIDALSDFGNALGVIRQIIDDCRDVFQGSQTNTFEVTLPLLLLAEKMDVSVAKLIGDFSSKESLSAALISYRVPEMISSVLLEWRRRAQENISIFDQKDNFGFLRSILEDFVSRPWLNVSHE